MKIKKTILSAVLFASLLPSVAFAAYNLDAELRTIINSNDLWESIFDFEDKFGTAAACKDIMPMSYKYAVDQTQIAIDALKSFNEIGCYTNYCSATFDDWYASGIRYNNLSANLMKIYIDVCIPLSYPSLSGSSNFPTSTTETKSCPINSTGTWGSCVCESGYLWIDNACITYNQSCNKKYGSNSYGDKEYCYCMTGYQFNSSKTKCEKIPTSNSSTTTVKTVTSTKKTTKTSTSKTKTSTVPCPPGKGCKCPTGYKYSVKVRACQKI